MQNAPLGAFCNTFELHKLPFVIKIFVLSIFEWPLKTGFILFVFIENYANLKEIVLCCAMTFELGKINIISSLCFSLILFGLNIV